MAHKKIERKKELDRRRKRREERLKERIREAKAAAKEKADDIGRRAETASERTRPETLDRNPKMAVVRFEYSDCVLRPPAAAAAKAYSERELYSMLLALSDSAAKTAKPFAAASIGCGMAPSGPTAMLSWGASRPAWRPRSPLGRTAGRVCRDWSSRRACRSRPRRTRSSPPSNGIAW